MNFNNLKLVLYNSPLILFMIFFNQSCNQKNSKSENIEGIIVEKAESLEKWSRDQSLITKSIVLNSEGNNFITNVSKLIFISDRYFIFDRFQRKLFVYNSNGNFLNNIGTRGKGPGEYLEIRDYQIYNNNVYLLDYNKIIIFNFDGSFKKEIRLDELSEKTKAAPLQFGITKNGNYIFWIGNQGEFTKKEILYVTDNNLKILGQYFTVDNKYPDSFRFNSRSGEHLFSGLVGDYNIYQIENGDCTPKFYVDFGKEEIVFKNVNNNKQQLYDRIERDGLIHSLREVHNTSELISFIFQKGNIPFMGIYNTQSKVILTSQCLNPPIFGGGIIRATYKDEFILYYPLETVNTDAFIDFTNIKIPETNSNPVFVHVKFKT